MLKSRAAEDRPTGRPVVAALVRSAEVEAALTTALVNDIEVELRARRVEEFDMTLLRALQGDAILLDIDPRDRRQLGLLTEFVAERGAAAVIVTSPRLDVTAMCELMGIGIHHIVPQPIARTELAGVVERALARRHAGAAPQGPGKGPIVSLIGSSGGVGKTSLAVHGASAVARRRAVRDICVIDLDIQFGCAALMLDVEQRGGSILDLIHNLGRMDSALLRGAMATGQRRRFDVLAAPLGLTGIGDADIKPEAISAVVALASSEYGLTILDLPLLWSHWTHAALRSSDHILLIVLPTVPSLRQGRRQIEFLRQEELDDIPLAVIVNRFGSGLFRGSTITAKDAATALGRKVDFVVPDSSAIREAAETGLPLHQLRGGRALENRIAVPFERVLQPQGKPAAPAHRVIFSLPFWRRVMASTAGGSR